jgi:hypothetical protein
MALAIRPQHDPLRITSGLDTLAGLWLCASAFMFQRDANIAWDQVLIGLAVAVLSSSRLGGYRRAWPSWIIALLGLWTLLSPWLIARVIETAMMWNTVVTGVVIISLAVWGALATEHKLSPGEMDLST